LKKAKVTLRWEIAQGFTNANLIRENIRESFDSTCELLSKSDQKRDEQYDDVVRRLDNLTQLLRYQPVLSIYPKTKRLHIDIALVGREDDLNWLVERVGRKQDCLLVGQPGSGKSFSFPKDN